MKKVWFITGSSRGLGRNITEAVLKSGDAVAATARNTDQLSDLVQEYGTQVLPVSLDVTRYEDVYKAVDRAVKHFGRIDVLVNNAGFGIVGAAEAFTDEQVRSQLETNLYAPIELTRAVLPYMRKQGSGRILQISSIGGRVGNAGLTIYQAAKFGLGGFTEALAKEVGPLGIYVTSVEPGGFRTDWSGASMTYAKEIEGYDMVKQRSDLFKSGKFIPVGDPVKAANVLVELAIHPEPPVHLILGSEALGILKSANATRDAEMEKWKDVTVSTDHDEAEDFLSTTAGQFYTQNVQRKQ
ncbi:SDR family NAD(P)-dependent oxidoreductase [Pseudobacter ginsenosidimutans]|uniref:Short-subunit dehydrogenase n=1 Tax=Pseudobacter ginsenosidimutans TaxID=661488 RepID=A0A4Q7MYF0_9BACT|nr:SDR family NAD(P)-dependent oxidoreductase [Pseudobacter ginsenosidimutans]QEC42887.1 SDR family NAD(P)-dependent oxidoreductase [Pseudobacter ginsenosidimutans]RZS74240.1 short-subunit dehydrogenase [Pseudobacter ginsenosidimutans]